MDGAVLSASVPGSQFPGDSYTCTVPSDADLAAAQVARTAAAAAAAAKGGSQPGGAAAATVVLDLDLDTAEAARAAAAAAAQPPDARLEAEPAHARQAG